MADSTTPDRQTYLELDGSFYAMARPAWAMRRAAEDIKRQEPTTSSLFQVSHPQETILIPDGAWTLRNRRGESAQLLTSSESDAIIKAADVETVGNYVAVDLFKALGFTGLGEVAGLTTSFPGFRKRVPAGGAWNGIANILVADSAAFAQPPLPITQNIPVDRVIRGLVAYPSNEGYELSFPAPTGFGATDVILQFYFGGTSPTHPSMEGGGPGTFCLSLRGSGLAYLFELNGDAGTSTNWKFRLRFTWAEPQQVADALHSIMIFPYAQDRILFITRHSEHVQGTGLLTVVGNASARPPMPHYTLYRENPGITGYTHTFSMTGPGVIRLDARRDFRRVISIFRLKFPATGTLIDNPIPIPRCPAGTKIYVSLQDTYTKLGGSITAQLYRFDNDAALTGDAVNGFDSVSGESCYYPVFTFNADSSRYTSPILFSYAAETQGVLMSRVNTPQVGGLLEQAAQTGPDIDPSHETFSLGVRATYGSFPILQVRDRIYARVNQRVASTGAHLTTLFEGETIRPRGKVKMNTDVTPPAIYRHYDPLRLNGTWARLASQVGRSLVDFRLDEHAAVDPQTGSKPPWKVTDIASFLLQDAGVPPDELDIPDIDFRLWAAPHLGPKDYMLQVGLSYTDYLTTLCLKILGRYLVRDPNAGPVGRGMWRLLTPAQPPYSNVLANFVEGEPLPFHIPNAPGAYGVGLWPMTDYEDFPIPPEFNYLLVTASGQITPNQQGKFQLGQEWFNPLSFDFLFPTLTADPNSPDFLGFFLPALHYDPLLVTQEAVDFVTARMADFAGHGKQACEFTSAHTLVWDPLDPLQRNYRSLRLNDVIRVGGTTSVLGRKAVVRSCNPYGWRDENWKQDVVAYYVE